MNKREIAFVSILNKICAKTRKNSVMICFKNAQQIDSINLLDRAFHYGDGCFTTARFHHNDLELKQLHWARLKLASERMFLQFDFEVLNKSITLLQQQFAVLDGTLKIVLSRGDGDRGYAMPEHAADIYVFYYPKKNSDFQPEFIQSGVLDQAMGLTMPNLVGLKTLNRLEQVMLKKEALEKGWQEALVTDVQGAIVEGVSSNCFIRLNNTWITPELRYNGVHGVMRAEILSRMHQQGISCKQCFIDMDKIQHMQSLFFCNTLSPMKIVSTLNHRNLDTQPCVELFETLHLSQFNSHAAS